MPVEPIGVAIGVAGILLAFKGVVDTVNLFDLIVSRDNGSRHLALKYHIERHRTTLWGDEHRADDEFNSPLLRETRSTRVLVAGILAEIRAAHELAAKYVKDYDMDQPGASKDGIEAALGIDSVAVTGVKALRDAKVQRKKFLWATKHKNKFLEIVSRMQSLNDDLYGLVRSDNTEALATSISAYILPQLKDSLSLIALQQAETTLDPLLTLSARLKQLQTAPLDQVANQAVKFTLGRDFLYDVREAPKMRAFGSFESPDHLPRRSWVEWKIVRNGSDGGLDENIVSRIMALATILSAPKPKEFCIPPCSGLLSIEQDHRNAESNPETKLGFVYHWPSESFDENTNPATLIDLMKREDQDMPLLNERFALAYSIASALSMFHATKWLHKGLRSDNILFFFDEKGTPRITSPYITGFDYSRPESQASLEARPTGQPELDLYYHPDVPLRGFNRVRDIYSLGVVLFEIARWAPLSEEIPRLDQMTPVETRLWITDSLPALGGQMGASYKEAVEVCITSAFGTAGDEEDTEALARAFFTKVLKRLSYCRV